MSETVKPFTDETLNGMCGWQSPPGSYIAVESSEFRALLARLAAAEACALKFADHWPDDREVKAWLKTRGL